MEDPSTCYCECNKAYKTDEYIDIKKCLCKKCPVNKLVLACEDEILNTTQTLHNDEEVTY